jgi:hypothetical protein
MLQYATTALAASPIERQNPADVALTLSRRLIAIAKVKNILQIEAGLEMIALAMTISSEVSCIDMFEDSDFLYPIRIMGYFRKSQPMSERCSGGEDFPSNLKRNIKYY